MSIFVRTSLKIRLETKCFGTEKALQEKRQRKISRKIFVIPWKVEY